MIFKPNIFGAKMLIRRVQIQQEYEGTSSPKYFGYAGTTEDGRGKVINLWEELSLKAFERANEAVVVKFGGARGLSIQLKCRWGYDFGVIMVGPADIERVLSNVLANFEMP